MSKSTKSSENGVCMLSLSRVNISYMCLNMSRSYWNVCVGRKTSIDFFYDDTLLEVVDNFKYLGTMFYKNWQLEQNPKMFSRLWLICTS